MLFFTLTVYWWCSIGGRSGTNKASARTTDYSTTMQSRSLPGSGRVSADIAFQSARSTAVALMRQESLSKQASDATANKLARVDKNLTATTEQLKICRELAAKSSMALSHQKVLRLAAGLRPVRVCAVDV